MKPLTGPLLAALLIASPAAAQTNPTVNLTPENPSRWDVAGLTGWVGVHKPAIAPSWDDWYDTASFGASLGYYWTPHVKLAIEGATGTEGGVTVQESIPAPGTPFPVFRYGERRFHTTSVSGHLVYQFFENAWFHPFAGGGVHMVREASRLELQEQRSCPTFCQPTPLPVEESRSYIVRPLVEAGFKLYMTERAFLRSDVEAAFGKDGAESIEWRGGIGFDF